MLLPRGLLLLVWACVALATPTSLISASLEPRDDTACPPTYTTKNGLKFTSYCSNNSPRNNLLANPLTGISTMAQYPDLTLGYANCLLKNNAPDQLSTPVETEGIIHSAIITSIVTPNTTCPSPNAYTSSPGSSPKQFSINCGQDNAGANITKIHSQNITSCMDSCATSDQGCVGVVFDSSLQQGYQNCYLKNTTSVGSSLSIATYTAMVSGSSSGSGSNSGSSDASEDGSGSSKA
ncbi:hypothetical protein P280DRAFT_516604 [Massarina eburnea CBS 473.64]|uniref:Apple domain-containing protein n=1 Tax=Massarina eburnea CBS 473.64 TaxID=1395130 RepID=A0A6A6S5D1_9PLEO|nr:hypothetical protein P280DRAFT_516604 [Massarina eburnea CBS 473.64]